MNPLDNELMLLAADRPEVKVIDFQQKVLSGTDTISAVASFLFNAFGCTNFPQIAANLSPEHWNTGPVVVKKMGELQKAYTDLYNSNKGTLKQIAKDVARIDNLIRGVVPPLIDRMGPSGEIIKDPRERTIHEDDANTTVAKGILAYIANAEMPMPLARSMQLHKIKSIVAPSLKEDRKRLLDNVYLMFALLDGHMEKKEFSYNEVVQFERLLEKYAALRRGGKYVSYMALFWEWKKENEHCRAFKRLLRLIPSCLSENNGNFSLHGGAFPFLSFRVESFPEGDLDAFRKYFVEETIKVIFDEVLEVGDVPNVPGGNKRDPTSLAAMRRVEEEQGMVDDTAERVGSSNATSGLDDIKQHVHALFYLNGEYECELGKIKFVKENCLPTEAARLHASYYIGCLGDEYRRIKSEGSGRKEFLPWAKEQLKRQFGKIEKNRLHNFLHAVLIYMTCRVEFDIDPRDNSFLFEQIWEMDSNEREKMLEASRRQVDGEFIFRRDVPKFQHTELIFQEKPLTCFEKCLFFFRCLRLCANKKVQPQAAVADRSEPPLTFAQHFLFVEELEKLIGGRSLPDALVSAIIASQGITQKAIDIIGELEVITRKFRPFTLRYVGLGKGSSILPFVEKTLENELDAKLEQLLNSVPASSGLREHMLSINVIIKQCFAVFSYKEFADYIPIGAERPRIDGDDGIKLKFSKPSTSHRLGQPCRIYDIEITPFSMCHWEQVGARWVLTISVLRSLTLPITRSVRVLLDIDPTRLEMEKSLWWLIHQAAKDSLLLEELSKIEKGVNWNTLEALYEVCPTIKEAFESYQRSGGLHGSPPSGCDADTANAILNFLRELKLGIKHCILELMDEGEKIMQPSDDALPAFAAEGHIFSNPEPRTGEGESTQEFLTLVPSSFLKPRESDDGRSTTAVRADGYRLLERERRSVLKALTEIQELAKEAETAGKSASEETIKICVDIGNIVVETKTGPCSFPVTLTYYPDRYFESQEGGEKLKFQHCVEMETIVDGGYVPVFHNYGQYIEDDTYAVRLFQQQLLMLKSRIYNHLENPKRIFVFRETFR